MYCKTASSLVDSTNNHSQNRRMTDGVSSGF